MEQREFLRTIGACRKRLNLAEFMRKLVFALGVGAGVGIVFSVLSFVTPLYYANVYAGLALVLAVLSALAAAFLRRVTMEQAALVMDGFGFQERIVTAYEHLQEEGTLLRLQREDAMRELLLHRDRIRIPLWPSRKKTAFSVLLMAVLLGLIIAPAEMKDRARELHQIRQEAEEKEKEIEKVLEELEAVEEPAREELTPEQLAALREMKESLQSSIAEYQQASTGEALTAAGEKLNYKYADMSSQMANLAQSLESGAAVSAMTAESMQAMAENLQQMSGAASQGGTSMASNQGQNGSGQSNQSGTNQGGQNGSGQSNQGGTNQSGTNQGGQNGSGQSNQNGNTQSGQGGSGQNGGQSGGSGEGAGGQGSGQGRGTGSSSTPHDYVSVPNAIADSGNLTGNASGHENSEYFRAQNGLSWEGTHMSHEAIIGSYEQNAYEGIAAGRYPSGMENVIKEYFASFN